MAWQPPPPPAAQRPPLPPAPTGYGSQPQGSYGGQKQGGQQSGGPAGQQHYWPPAQPQQHYQQYPQDYSNANTAPAQQHSQYTQSYNAGPAYSQHQPTTGHYNAQPAEQWGDNWDWGWDDTQRNTAQPQPPQYNNANIIEESFASTDTWNWTTDDNTHKQDTPNDNQQPSLVSEAPLDTNSVVEPCRSASNHSAQAPAEEIKTLRDRDVVKEHLPSLALGKRLHLEDLTPQWSIESQMSQESSEGPHTHSEGTYRSENLSRNSSSPGPNMDSVNFNYSQPIEESPPEWGRGDGCDITDSMQDLSIANREVPEPVCDRRDSAHMMSREQLAAPTLLPPPSGFAASSSAGNPFKLPSHKKPPAPSAASFPAATFTANLEMAPDNAERPDAAPAPTPGPAPLSPDNLEVAPHRARDQYMQTALAADYNTDYNVHPPPPPPAGLRRLVQGASGAPGDEPPPRNTQRLPQRPRADGQPDMERARLPPGDGRDTAPTPPPPDDEQRELTVEGENLQDLSAVSSAELSPPAVAVAPAPPPPEPARRHSARSDADDSERAYNASPRRDRHKPPRDHERDSDGRYSRGERERGYSRDERRDERRTQRDERRVDERRRRHERTASPRRRRYDTDDTDYCSDRERERRRHREGSQSHAARPPRPDERRRYRDIDPARLNNTSSRSHHNRTREPRGGEREREWSGDERRRTRHSHRDRDHRSHRDRDRDRQRDYYDGVPVAGAVSGGYSLSAQQYAYYESLRRSDPAAYLRLYHQLCEQHIPGYVGAPTAVVGNDPRGSERGSGHSGRSSAHRLNDTYYGAGAEESLRGAALSLRTDLSDRELNTDASMTLHLDESTVRSDRMTPLKYCTPHVKGSLSSAGLVVIRGQYPADGRPAAVSLLPLATLTQRDPRLTLYQRYPGPLVKGVTHKKSVIEYCAAQARAAAAGAAGGVDAVGAQLLWDLLALLLRQNGVVVGADIAELLMKSQRDQPLRADVSRRDSYASGSESQSLPRDWSRPTSPLPAAHSAHTVSEPSTPALEAGGAALDTYREYLSYGNRQQAIEYAMSAGLWGHALALSQWSGGRERALVTARFLAALPARDPLHTLYCQLAGRHPPALTCAADPRWGDWRSHLAVMLANTSAQPQQDVAALTQLGDSLSSRGLIASAQVCYLSAGVPFTRHRLAPLQASPAASQQPRLALLLADPAVATLSQLATDQAIIATEIYEYAVSLSHDYCIPDLQVYKLMLACRLVDCGLHSRALGYVESAARCLMGAPHHHSALLARQLHALADRLRAHDVTGDTHHQRWIDDLLDIANGHQSELSQPVSPEHQYQHHNPLQQPPEHQYQPQQQIEHQHQPQVELYEPQPQYQSLPPPAPQLQSPYSWGEQPSSEPPSLSAAAPLADPADSADPDPAPAPADWGHTPADDPGYNDYWQGYSYGESGVGGGGITMPGGRSVQHDDDRVPSPDNHTERESDPPAPSNNSSNSNDSNKQQGGNKQQSGWLGGIFNKLSLRAPNQMILPDDRNPSIVWDPDRKRWRDLDGGDEEPAGPPPPPPGAKGAPPGAGARPLSSSSPLAPPAAIGGNMFKMQKNRNIKKSYVDVFNGAPSSRAAPPPAPLAPSVTNNTNYFVPNTQSNL